VPVADLPAGAGGPAGAVGVLPVAGAGDCVAAATSVVAQRRAHASAQANDVVRLILRADRTLAARFEATAAVTKRQNGIIAFLSESPSAALKFNSDTLLTHLEQQLLPVYLISGDEPLLTAEATDAVRAKARAAGFTERETHFMERGGDWNDVRANDFLLVNQMTVTGSQGSVLIVEAVP